MWSVFERWRHTMLALIDLMLLTVGLAALYTGMGLLAMLMEKLSGLTRGP